MDTQLVGYTTERRHYQATPETSYAGAIPVDDVRDRLFGWEAQERELAYAEQDGAPFTGALPGWKAITRSDSGDLLHIHRGSYAVHQYGEWLLDNVAHLVDDGLVIGRARLLKNGARAYVQVELPDTITTPQGVDFRPYLLAATSHDGSLASTYRTMANVLICDNQLSAALYGGDARGLRVRHTSNSSLRLMDARAALGIVHTVAETFEAQVAKLTAKKISRPKWTAFVEAFVPLAEGASPQATARADVKRGQLNQLWNNDERVTPWKGTAYGVVQAVNTWAHHMQTVRGVERSERNMARAVTGDVDSLDARTLATLDRVLA